MAIKYVEVESLDPPQFMIAMLTLEGNERPLPFLPATWGSGKRPGGYAQKQSFQPNHRSAAHVMVSRLIVLATGSCPGSRSDDENQHHLPQ
jgi:hypothetical protein